MLNKVFKHQAGRFIAPRRFPQFYFKLAIPPRCVLRVLSGSGFLISEGVSLSLVTSFVCPDCFYKQKGALTPITGGRRAQRNGFAVAWHHTPTEHKRKSVLFTRKYPPSFSIRHILTLLILHRKPRYQLALWGSIIVTNRTARKYVIKHNERAADYSVWFLSNFQGSIEEIFILGMAIDRVYTKQYKYHVELCSHIEKY